MFVSRSDWGARYGRGHAGLWTRSQLWVHTEAGALVPDDWTIDQAAQRVRNIERYHRYTREFVGIGYSWLVDPIHGWIFEGRGWGRDGGHTAGYNTTSYAVAFLGHGDHQPVTERGWLAAAQVVRDGLDLQALPPGYSVGGHRDVAAKSCPGDLVYPHIGVLRALSTSHYDEWDTMATKEELRDAVREVLSEMTFLGTADGRQWIVYALAGQAVWIRTREDFDRLRQAFPHRGAIDLDDYQVIT